MATNGSSDAAANSYRDEDGLTPTQRTWLEHIQRCEAESMSFKSYCARDGIEVYLCVEPVDFRKQVNGLSKLYARTITLTKWTIGMRYETGPNISLLITSKTWWSPGRHGPGNNLFFMVQDPHGNQIEISAELEHMPREMAPRFWPLEERTLNLWGAGWLRD